MTRTMKDSGIEWIGEIPEDWETQKNKYLLDFVYSGGTPTSSEEKFYSDEGIPFVAIGDMSNNEFVYDTDKHLTTMGIDDKNLKILKEGTILYSIYATLGAVSELKVSATINQAMLALIPKNHVCKNYYKYSLKAIRDYAVSETSANTQANLNLNKVKNYYLPVPSMSEQQKIADFLDKKCSHIDSILEKTKASIDECKQLKQSVITQAVTKGIRPNRPMKDSGIEWIGQIPEDWEVRKIKSLGQYRNGLTYAPEDMCEEFNGTLVLRSSNVKQGKISYGDNIYVSTTIPKQLYVRKGDILVCSRNGSRDLIGKNAIIKDDITASFGAFMMIYRCDTPEYMYYILNSHIFNYYLGSFLTSTINQLTGKNFGSMNVVYCSNTTEQQEIVSYLDDKCSEIDKLITKKEKLIEELETYKKSLIYEYVTGKKEVI